MCQSPQLEAFVGCQLCSSCWTRIHSRTVSTLPVIVHVNSYPSAATLFCTVPTLSRVTICASLVDEIPADEDNLSGIGVEGQTILSPSNKPERVPGDIRNEDRTEGSECAQIECVDCQRGVRRPSGKETGIQIRVRYHGERRHQTS